MEAKARRAVRRETPAPHARAAAGPDNPGAQATRRALLVGMPIADAIADANTLRMLVAEGPLWRRRTFREQLENAGRFGSEAAVLMLDADAGDADPALVVLARFAALIAARAARRAAPGLRR